MHPSLCFPLARLSACLLLLVPATAQTLLHVDASVAPGGDGLTWSSAFSDLQDALDLARSTPSVQTIQVAQGTYLPDRGTLDRSRSFELVSGVQMLGGFQTGGNANDWQLYPTLLSGDLTGNDGPPGAGGWIAGWSENSEHVVIGNNLSAGSALVGFHVIGGNSNASSTTNGGACWIQGGQVRLENCEFSRSRAASWGGGLALQLCSAEVIGCRFLENRGDRSGGGAATLGPVTTVWRNCQFLANVGGGGAGLYCGPTTFFGTDGSSSIIQACLFQGNQGIVGATQGGGLLLRSGTQALVEDCRFLNNETNGGGGIYVATGDARVDRCHFESNQTNGDGGGALFFENFGNATILPSQVLNCTMWGNSGALMAVNNPVSYAHCTIVDNQVPGNNPGLLWPASVNQNSLVELRQCIVWGNYPIGTGSDERNHFFSSLGGTYAFQNCLVQDWAGLLPGTAINANPEFLDPLGPDGVRWTVADNRYDLAGSSPALDAAQPGSLPTGDIADAWLRARFSDGDGDGLAQADLGALERTRIDDFGVPFCHPQPANSSGLAAFCMATGSPAVTLNQMRIWGEFLPVGEFGYLLNSRGQGLVEHPGGSLGNLCLGGGFPIGRHNRAMEIVQSDAQGQVFLDLDLTNMATNGAPTMVLAGETWNFQWWHRDTVMGASVSNFSAALAITME